MRAVMAGRALLAGDGGRGMVHKPARKGRRVVTVAAVRSRRNRYVTRDHADGAQSIVTGLTSDWMPCQHVVIECAAHVERGDVVARIASERDVAGVGVWTRCGVLSWNCDAIGHHARAVVASALTARSRHDDLRIGVIRKRCRECRRGVAGVALHRDAWVPRRIGVAGGTDCDGAVVTRRAAASDTGVVERPVGIEIHP